MAKILNGVAYLGAGFALAWLIVEGVGWEAETAKLATVIGQMAICLFVAAVTIRQTFTPLQRAYYWAGVVKRFHWLLPICVVKRAHDTLVRERDRYETE